MRNFKDKLLSEIDEFREQGNRFLNGELSKIQFKEISCGMGVYAQRNQKSFVLRLRIPSGITSFKELQFICEIAEKFGLEKVHLTTRECIQLHDLSIDQVCEIMREGIENNVYTRGSGGNYPRNVAMSPLSGVDILEAFDVTPYAMAVNNYFLRKITEYHLPRKLKVSFSSSNMDTSHATITDLGFLALIKDNKKYFKVYIGGGLGLNPRTGICYDELIEPCDILYHVEAITKLLMEKGDYQNKHKSRVRALLNEMGQENFMKFYKKCLEDVSMEDLKIYLSEHEIHKEGIEIDGDYPRVFKQKQPGLYSVYVHPIGGQLYIKDLKRILYVLDAVEDLEIRFTMTEGIYFRNLNGKEAKIFLSLTEDIVGNTHLEQSIACIGVPICQIGIVDSQKMLNNIIKYFKENNYKKDVLPRIHISGCGNSCGIHQACLIGLTGRKMRINDELKEVFELYMNGSFEAGSSRIGKSYGIFEQEKIPELLYDLELLIENENTNFKDFIDNNEDKIIDLLKKYN